MALSAGHGARQSVSSGFLKRSSANDDLQCNYVIADIPVLRPYTFVARRALFNNLSDFAMRQHFVEELENEVPDQDREDEDQR